MAYLQVTTVADTQGTASDIARSAVENKLAASAQIIGPAVSIFWHHGSLGEATEWLVLLKTSSARYEELRRHLLDVHPWENVEVSAVEIIGVTEEYGAWIDRTVAK